MTRTLPTQLRQRAEINRVDAEVDVIVVGLGCAGASAMMEACDAGAEVLVLERAGGGGGTSANSGGLIYLGGGTPVQKAAGFDDDPEEMFKFLVAVSSPAADEEKIRLFCESSVEHFHWLEAQGVPFKRSFYPEPSLESKTDDCVVYSGGEDGAPFDRIARPAPRGHKPQTEGKAGPFFMQKMLAAVETRSADIRANHLVETLVVDEAGRVVGVVAREAGEERVFLARRGVVLAAGGFSSNREMLARHVPQLLPANPKNATEGDDGRALKMGQSAGGELVRMDQAEVALPSTIPHTLSRGVYVNRLGQRFINEDTYYGHIGIEALFGQEGKVWLVLDDATFERGMLTPEPCAVGETIEELEREAGFPEGSLQATLDFYNAAASRGKDPLFGKRAERLVPLTSPPFALIDCGVENYVYACMTLGGLRTGLDGEVLSSDGKTIPGLYAVGRSAALFTGRGYAASGISLADGTFFGRRAGRAAASVEA
ncbi:MAG: FAD-dependent oxidoreductase [Planctomycetota bacterium]